MVPSTPTPSIFPILPGVFDRIWDYTLSWLTNLPFELIAPSITIQYWRDDISMTVWVHMFLVVFRVTQMFGVRRDPGAFRNGLDGFTGVFVVAAFSFGGI
ncbi:hypothetical protein VTK26DRAFT_9169 [Humicola hyalothermophila]